MRISDWSSDVCSSDLGQARFCRAISRRRKAVAAPPCVQHASARSCTWAFPVRIVIASWTWTCASCCTRRCLPWWSRFGVCYLIWRSEEHTSELQSLMRISYAVFCLKKKKTQKIIQAILRYSTIENESLKPLQQNSDPCYVL